MFTLVTLLALLGQAEASSLPQGFVYLHQIDPSILEEMRYATSYNFVGRPIEGYQSNRCILTRPAAMALSKAQRAFAKHGLTLKVYDCYRPQKAVEDFERWARDPNDTRMKRAFYPHVNKAKLFDRGYISHRSAHTHGSTVDLTLVPLPVPPQATYRPGDPLKDVTLPQAQRFEDNSVDMGTGYDALDPLAHTDNPYISKKAKKNRKLLQRILGKYGFVHYPKEWWHFTFQPELYGHPFNFDVL